MNNSQFRKLLVDTPARQPGGSESNNGAASTPGRNGATPSALGSKMRSSIPMTPRSVATSGGIDFARQLADRNSTSSNPKTFKSRNVRGSRLAEGYTDRTKSRVDEDEDDKAKRVKALEEMLKLQQIDQATFEKLRDEIVGGDVSSVHLVKGLDFKLLERVRRGEDVLAGQANAEEDQEEDGDGEDVEDELDELEDKEVTAIEKEKTKKKGQIAAPGLVPGQKRTRDAILAEMKAARLAAKGAAGPSLGSKFTKIGSVKPQSRIERDGKGREVLITVDENGNEKRKVRKIQQDPAEEKGHGLLMPDKDLVPLGMEVPSIPEPAPEEDEDIDIFDDAGDDYDPLAGLSEADSDSEKEDGEVPESKATSEKPSTSSETASMPPPPKPSGPRNYFNEKPLPTASSTTPSGPKGLSDPTLLAALKKASSLTPIAAPKSAEEKALEEKRKRMLQQDDRDAQDMDMGFGSSRFEDEADLEDDGSMKLSNWGAEGDDDGEGGGRKGKKERKRGGKKRKGDVNSAADVLGAMERRKAAGS